jgi:galactonate dehydratase
VRITKLESFLCNAGLRNYLFLKLHTDEGIVGVSEASLEWQEEATQRVLHEFFEQRYVIGANPFDVEQLCRTMIRDQYQGGPVALTAISGIEIGCWDIIGKALGQPLYNLLGGVANPTVRAYANGWYGGKADPAEYARRAKSVVEMGYTALKFDPFGTAFKNLDRRDVHRAIDIVSAVADAVGPEAELLIEGHGRLSVHSAIEVARELERFPNIGFFEEPVTPDSLDLLKEVKDRTKVRIAAGERLYTLSDFFRFCSMRAAEVVQFDIDHIGGISQAKKVAAMAEAQDIFFAPHSSVGPVAAQAALHIDISTPNLFMQEAFHEFDVAWRSDFVCGWNPVENGTFKIPTGPGLGIGLDEDAIRAHPPVPNCFPSLWDAEWIAKFDQNPRGPRA